MLPDLGAGFSNITLYQDNFMELLNLFGFHIFSICNQDDNAAISLTGIYSYILKTIWTSLIIMYYFSWLWFSLVSDSSKSFYLSFHSFKSY